VHEAIVFWNVDSTDNSYDESNTYIGTHNSSRSRFRFKGSAKIDADWSAGFLMEFGVRANHLGATWQDSPNSGGQRIDIRHEALYLKSKRMGTIWLGWTSSAADGITEICLGCGLGNGPDFSDDMAGLRTTTNTSFGSYGGVGAFVGEGDRREIIRYISPEFAGFVVSTAYGHDDFYDVALRYANEFNGVRVAAGVAYQHDTSGTSNGGNISAAACTGSNGRGGSPGECDSIGASASVQHVASGFYVAGAYGRATDKLVAANLGDTVTGWHITGGVNRKFSPLGSTNIWGLYTNQESEVGFANGASTELTVYGVGIEQSIDAAAMNIYLWWKHMNADVNGMTGVEAESDQIVLGARVRF
jgi:predicted porin